VDGICAVSSSPSLNTAKPFAGVFGTTSLFFDVLAGGGGISVLPGSGSLYGTICDAVPEPEAVPVAIRVDLPGCLMVVPAIFFTPGTFSFILTFRPPSSGQAFV
jgi:hypothetical protein